MIEGYRDQKSHVHSPLSDYNPILKVEWRYCPYSTKIFTAVKHSVAFWLGKYFEEKKEVFGQLQVVIHLEILLPMPYF